MAERNPALDLQNRTDHTAENDRAFFQAVFGSREGVVLPADLAVTQNGTPNLSVNVAAGWAAVDGDDNANQGFYVVWNDATKNLAIASSDVTNPRRDLVVARVRDAFYTGATNAFDLFVVTGVAAASPVDPAIPNNSLVLARVAVAANASTILNANITDLRVRTSALNSVVPVLAAGAPSVQQGYAIYVTDANQPSGSVAPQTAGRPNVPGFYVADGTKWNAPWNMPWGVMGYAQTTTAQTGITTEADLTSLTITFTAVANRRLRIYGVTAIISTNTASTMQLSIKKDGTQIGRGLGQIALGAGSTITAAAVDTPSTGAHTYKLTLQVAAGGATTATSPGATDPAWILVEDLGPNGQPT